MDDTLHWVIFECLECSDGNSIRLLEQHSSLGMHLSLEMIESIKRHRAGFCEQNLDLSLNATVGRDDAQWHQHGLSDR